MASILYIARDIERALGIEPVGDYYIVTNKTPLALEKQKQYPHNIWIIDSPEVLDTYALLMRPEIKEILNLKKSSILVFKNNNQIEEYCRNNSWHILNPSAVLSEKVENKISQVKWLGELASLLPPHKIVLAKDIVWDKKAFVLQWSHGHTGDGTLLIQNEVELKKLQEKYPHREARVTDFIKGPMFTVNIAVTGTVILLGNISYQITGILPFTENPFSTIGNDWSLTHSLLSENHITQFHVMAEKIAKKMQDDGWLGLFGIDVIYDEEKDELHLIEINARQPASTTYESQLQNLLALHGVSGINIFEAHLQSLLKDPVSSALIPINDGAQILQRVTEKIKVVDTKKLNDAGYITITYTNNKPNTDLVRIQSLRGIMETHTKFNERGKSIVEFLL